MAATRLNLATIRGTDLRLFIWFLILIYLGAAASSEADDTGQFLHLLTEENPPYSYLDQSTNEITGTGVILVKELMERSGIAYSIQLLPWQRAYRRAQGNENTCVFMTNRTPAREELFQWVGPLLEGGWAVFKKPDNPVVIEALPELKRYNVVGKSGSASIDDAEARADIKVTRTTSDEAAAKMLYHGRADFWISGVIDAPHAAKAANLPPPSLALLWKKADLSMACSRATNPEFIAKLNTINASLDALRKKVLARHGLEASSQK